MGWSKKYKKSINCNNPKGFSQKAHCAGRKKENVMSSKLEELVGKRLTEEQFDEAAGKKDACYHKVKARYDVWPSAYASGALVKCRRVGAKNWGNKSKKEGVDEKVLGGKDMTSGIDKNTKITFDKRIMNKKLAGKTFVVVKKGINTFNVRPDGSGNERDTKTLDAPTLLKLVKNRTISKIVNSKGKAIHEQSVNEEKYVVYVDKDGKGIKGRKIVKSGLSQMGAKRLYNKLVKTDDYHEVGYDDHKSWNQNNIEKINEGDIESRELKLYIDNDSQLYNSRFMPIMKNLSKKMKKGNFDKKLAIKGFMILVDDGAKKYVKDFGGNAKEMFSKKDRIAVASDLADEFEDAYKNKEYSFMEGLGDMIGKSIGKYNKKRKKNMDALKKLKKKESVEEAYDIWMEDGSFGYTFTGLVEAEYQGRKVKLGKPMRGDVKKFKVYVKNPAGNVVKVNFGQGKKNPGGTMRIRKSNPKARANFRARHNCDNPGPRHKARYWSCRKW